MNRQRLQTKDFLAKAEFHSSNLKKRGEPASVDFTLYALLLSGSDGEALICNRRRFRIMNVRADSPRISCAFVTWERNYLWAASGLLKCAMAGRRHRKRNF